MSYNEDPAATRLAGITYWEVLAKKYPDRERALSGLAASLFYKPDYERALSIYEQLSHRFPSGESYKRNIALMCRYISSNSSVRNDLAKRRVFVERAIAIDRARVQAMPLNRQARLDLSFDLVELSLCNQQANDLTGALRVSEEVAAIRESLVQLDDRDEQAKDRLLFALCRLGKLQALLKQFPESGNYYRRALALGEVLSRNPSEPNTQFASLLREAKGGVAKAAAAR